MGKELKDSPMEIPTRACTKTANHPDSASIIGHLEVSSRATSKLD
jgi:hypothetical protein